METYHSICFKHICRLPVMLLISQSTAAFEKGPSSSTLLWNVFQIFSKIENCLLYDILLYTVRENHSFRRAAYLNTFPMALQFNFLLHVLITSAIRQQAYSSHTHTILWTQSFNSLSCIQHFNPSDTATIKTRTKKYIFLNEEWKSEFSHTVGYQGPPLTEVGDVQEGKIKVFYENGNQCAQLIESGLVHVSKICSTMSRFQKIRTFATHCKKLG